MATTIIDMLGVDTVCEHCQIVSIDPNNKYCDGCTEELIAYLVQHYEMSEQYQLENGWY